MSCSNLTKIEVPAIAARVTCPVSKILQSAGYEMDLSVVREVTDDEDTIPPTDGQTGGRTDGVN